MRTQTKLKAHGDDETARAAAELLRAIARRLRAGDRPLVTPAVGDLIEAGQELNRAMADVERAECAPRPMNRAQRRARKRR
ncbi:hypothetical protein [Corynebacterium tapiri]|uniref:Uncharacterized protein n=1 Tax=Corynebacterium tapiri TaxID=1448266 RepID=A0A5C4U255_9CORY|nr:hypothetical protein [Corynebacterium tapiri]TNL94611.1 hypothetical protein FHE74_10365 [Corynebacterium tapiri]